MFKKFGKYEKKFVRMMIKVFSTISGLFIILTLMGVSIVRRIMTFGVMLVISFVFRKFYWNYLEGLELKEQMETIV